MARTGVQIMKDLLAEPSHVARENMILDAFKNKEVPSWFFQFRPIRVNAIVDGKMRELEFLASPDYVSLGNDEDYFRAPMLPSTAQAVADEVDAILPSKRLVDVVYVRSNAKLVPIKLPNVGNPMDTSLHEVAIQQQMKALGYPPGISAAGHKKDIVVGPNLDGSKVAIYGWHDITQPLDENDPDKKKIGSDLPGMVLDAKRIQGYSTVHSSQFKDYSHGTRLIKRSAFLDGQPIDIEKVFTDPKLSILVSDQGPFVPRFPNKKATASSSIVETSADAEKVLLGLGIDLGLGLENALLNFQKKMGISPTGTLNTETRAALDAASKPKEKPFYARPAVLATGAGIVGAAAIYYFSRKGR